MMNKLKKLYRDFFGLAEAMQNPKDMEISADVALKNPNALKLAQDTAAKNGGNVKITNEEEIVDEAQLINNIIDYRGGVEYVLRNPAEAESVANEIREWATRKGFTIVKQSATGKVGYFYFRLGQDPGRESQRIQGYIAQKPEIKHFRFKVRGEKPAPRQAAVAPVPAPQPPQENI